MSGQLCNFCHYCTYYVWCKCRYLIIFVCANTSHNIHLLNQQDWTSLQEHNKNHLSPPSTKCHCSITCTSCLSMPVSVVLAEVSSLQPQLVPRTLRKTVESLSDPSHCNVSTGRSMSSRSGVTCPATGFFTWPSHS